MPDDLYFEGDPAQDSRRRHLERVLKGDAPRRKWPWILALAAGGSAWAVWRATRRPDSPDPSTQSAATPEIPRKS